MATPKKAGKAKASGKGLRASRDVIYPGGGMTDKLGRSATLSSRISNKYGKTIKTTLASSNENAQGNSRPSTLTRKNTTLGQGGRRENTVTRKYSTANVPMRNYNDLEIYRIAGPETVTEVQHNRGSGTRKTGAKKKGY
jgi:hypothetical protein